MQKIYDYLNTHKALRWGTLLSSVLLCVFLVLHVSYKEDISDFLPLGTQDRESLNVYQEISGANNVVILFSKSDDTPASDDSEASLITSAIDSFCDKISSKDTCGYCRDITYQYDYEKIEEIQDFVYSNMPYFLTDDDYIRMDSLLHADGMLDRQLQQDKELLMFPTGDFSSKAISNDPLNLFAPVMSRLRHQQRDSHFEMHDGYIFTPDMRNAIVLISSPFGNAETEKNSQLVSVIESAITDVEVEYPQLRIHSTGGPQIAVGNARQIKQDSILAISLAVILISLLLLYTIRSIRNILLIFLTIAWGWLFALAGMYLFHDDISIIVIGISSVILGIAINYPLHLVTHAGHVQDTKQALKEILTPLVIGNITTVGAFAALVPLQSTALKDLGLFASLLLVGTILYVILYLPHQISITTSRHHDVRLLTRISSVRLEEKRWLVCAVAILTPFLAWFSLDVEFDSNLSNINYMDESNRRDMEYFQGFLDNDSAHTTTTLYAVSSADNMDAALDKAMSRQGQIDSLLTTKTATSHSGVTDFLVSGEDQKRRIGRWNDFILKNKSLLTTELQKSALRNGFSSDAFRSFHDIISSNYEAQSFDYFRLLTTQVFSGNISIDRSSGRYSVVDKIEVRNDKVADVQGRMEGSFDIATMNASLTNTLSDNFNYIGIVCSCIVFFFLWFSFRNLALAVIAFIPMAISWIWILGIMSLLGIKFNIVNIILATFIFGQGDDYTIFITEGCQYEYTHKQPMLASYKNSIILSALIMFIGIGTLIFAKHPALHSLAEVTIVGMACVVLMAWLIPPLLYKWFRKTRK